MSEYPAYKDSGLPWLGQVPSHWDVRRNGRLFSERNQTGYGDLPILEVSLKTGVSIRDMDNLKRKQVMSDREKYKRAVKGDIAYNMMRMWQGAVGVVPEDGLVSPAYVVALPYPEAEPRYFSYLFRSEAYKNEIDGFSRGIVKDRNRLYWEDFKRIPSCFPPPDEQKAIADYLDANAVKVRRFIRNRRRLIEVLNEQKQAIINRAVTRGLDPNAPLKTSGIDWLGDIPEHWEARALRSLGRFMKGGGGSKEDDKAEGVPCIRYGHLYMFFNYVIEEPKTFIAEDRAMDYGRTRQGDVLFTASGEDMAEIGKSAVNLIPGEVCCGGDLIILRLNIDMDSRFMGYAAQSWHAACQKSRLGRGTTVKHVYETQLKNVWIALPPKGEQTAIASHIQKSLIHLNALTTKARDEISLIQEYRTRLIADVVTGKVDVRALTSAESPLKDDHIDEGIDDEELSEGDEAELVEEMVDE